MLYLLSTLRSGFTVLFVDTFPIFILVIVHMLILFHPILWKTFPFLFLQEALLFNRLFLLFPRRCHLNYLFPNHFLSLLDFRLLSCEIYCLLIKQHFCLRNNINLLRHQHWNFVKEVLWAHRIFIAFIVYYEWFLLLKCGGFLFFTIAYLHKYISFVRHKPTVKWWTVLLCGDLAQYFLDRLYAADCFLPFLSFLVWLAFIGIIFGRFLLSFLLPTALLFFFIF